MARRLIERNGCRFRSSGSRGRLLHAMTAILGISALYHDSAAALVVDGEIAAAAQEERFSRRKNDRRFPRSAIQFCLQAAGLAPADLDFVAFYEKPLLKFDRVLETSVAFAPRGFRPFSRSIPAWLKHKLHVTGEIRRHLPGFTRRVLFAEHHESHAASAFFPSPFEEAAILTLDGVGEWATATLGIGRGNQVQLLRELRFPHSLGLLYSALTSYCGFEVDSGEYKLMGLAPYGQPTYLDVITQHVVDVKPDGSLWLDMSYFDFGHGLRMTSAKFHRLFGGPPRPPEAPLEQRHLDIAASIQQVTEEVVLRMARCAHEQTGLPNLCLAGGVALNAVANGRVMREGPFADLWIQPAAGDAGGALGAALLVWHQLLGNARIPCPHDSQHGSLLGPAFNPDQIRTCLTERGATFREFPDASALCTEVATLLSSQKAIGWFQGRMEFGPRALGNRSILADPRDPDMQKVLNLKIKFRESFRPFAPAVLAEHAHDYFELPAGDSSPYMLLVTGVCPSKRLPSPPDPEEEPPGLARQSIVRSVIPAVTHVDDSARIQTVDGHRNRKFALLLQEFYRHTGCPLLLNTSFNVRDEPIVCSPADAYECFLSTGLDALAIGNFVLLKDQQLASPGQAQSQRSARPPALVAGERPQELDDAVSPQQLRNFGGGLVVLTGITALLGWRAAGSPAGWWALCVLLAGCAALFWMFPASRAAIYRGAICLVWPLNWLASTSVLALIYFGLLTPIAVCQRLWRRDILQLRPDHRRSTYWNNRTEVIDRDRSLRQF